MKVLVVVDMQNDFLVGSLGSKMTADVIPNVINKIESFQKEGGYIVATMDTHDDTYLNTQEGTKLPIPHCIVGTEGYNIYPKIDELLRNYNKVTKLIKRTFGSDMWPTVLSEIRSRYGIIESIELVGVCTDICVISNALVLKALFPEIPIKVDSNCCAGTSSYHHTCALEAMKSCQVEVF